MIIVSGTLFVIGFILILPTLSDLWSLLFPRPLRQMQESSCVDACPRLLVLVPAHNEELLIETCVRSIRSMDYPSERLSLVVIADNCSDRTAELAREAGATLLEREDPENRGKPRALAWALEHLPVHDHDAVVIIDADSVVDSDFGRAVARHAPLRSRAIQTFHYMRNPGDSALTRMGAVLATAYYRFMFPLKQRGGLNVPLTGNGMCIGTGILQEHGWRAFTIAEDTELYVRLSEAGYPVEVAADAIVRSQEARELEQSRAQRQRWRAGRITILGHLGPRIVVSPRLTFHQKLDILGELLVPGPVVHLGTVTALIGITSLVPLPLGPWILALLGASLIRNSIYTVLAIRAQPDPVQSIKSFAFLPIYLGWRLVQEVLAFQMVGRDKAWIRTGRHPEEEATPSSTPGRNGEK